MMKRYIAACLTAAFVLAFSAVARAAGTGGFAGPSGTGVGNEGGYTGPGPGLMTVAQALGMSHDSGVTLRGRIVQRLGDELYLFRDNTGSIKVDISRDKWNGQQVGPNDMLEIQGEVDKEWNSMEIEVNRLIKM